MDGSIFGFASNTNSMSAFPFSKLPPTIKIKGTSSSPLLHHYYVINKPVLSLRLPPSRHPPPPSTLCFPSSPALLPPLRHSLSHRRRRITTGSALLCSLRQTSGKEEREKGNSLLGNKKKRRKKKKRKRSFYQRNYWDFGSMVSSSSPSSRIRELLLGLGYWVQGFRCFPWLAVNFFLKDGLNVNSSTLQLLQNSANLPMIGKPLYGVVSDAVYISGQHRIPYIAIGTLLQAISWLGIALLSPSSTSMITLSLYLLLSNLGASLAEVANDAIVAEAGKSSSSSPSSSSSSSSSSELQSFVWIASSAGGVIGNLLGGIALTNFSPQPMFLFFAIVSSLQFLITISVPERSLNLPKAPSNPGITKQLLQLSSAVCKPEIARSIAWLAASYAIIPALTGTMFYYQTQHLKINSSVLGISKVFGQAAVLVWSVVYNRRLKFIPARKLIAAIQMTMALLMVSDVLFVRGFYRNMGVPDSLYVVIFSGLLEVLYFFKLLPFNVVMAQLCPPGCEGSLMALVASAVALSLIVSGYLGIALVSFVGVTGDDFSRLPRGLMIQALCTAAPVYWASCIPDGKKLA